MIALTDQMREMIDNALANGSPCLLATAGADGAPDIGFKGSMMIFDNESLAYWERTKRQHLKNVQENPKVVVLFRHPGHDVGWKFRCTAAVYRNGPMFQRVMKQLVAEGLLREVDGTGTAVVLRVDQILTLYGEVLQERVPNLSW